MLLDLPNDAMRSVALHLEAPEVLNLLSTHKEFSNSLGTSATFWHDLSTRDFDAPSTTNHSEKCPKAARTNYLTQAYTQHLPAAHWYPIRRSPQTTVSAREGHLACTLPGPNNSQRVVITGGYSDDESVYLMTVPSCKTTSNWSWIRLLPSNNSRPSFTYGASLTFLDECTEQDGTHVARAIRFGGFQSGGYSHEVKQVWLLTVKTQQSGNPTVEWELVPTNNAECATPRAYHTATLVAGRYLVILGGMMWRESILGEAILDTQTWTWTAGPFSTFGDDQPSGRHGHSTILDNRRNRLVLFGGGSGTDLLRSGRDNSEVWELKMNSDWETKLTFPWTWTKLHADTCNQSDSDDDEDEDEDDEEGASSDDQVGGSASPPLSPAEALCIGRCHHGLKVTPNTAVLLFGSGRPSTNGMIGYDLARDCFMRPKISGPLPTPRFSGVAVYLEQQGYILTQGGYSSQQSDCIDDLTILDLAPYMKREFTVLPVDMGRRPHREITNADAENGRMNRYGGNMYQQHQFLTQMLAMTRGGLVTAEELEEMLGSRGIFSNNGVVVLGGDDAEDYDDADYEDEDDEDFIDYSYVPHL